MMCARRARWNCVEKFYFFQGGTTICEADRDEAEEKAGAGKVVRVKDKAGDREVTHPAREESACVRTAVPPHRMNVESLACKRHARDAAAR